MPLTKGQSQFITLVRIGTGLSFRTLYTWVQAEGGPDDNPLNIMADYPRIAHYGSPARAAVATIANLRKDKSNSNGYLSILKSATKNDSEQLKAIAASKWEETHYANGAKLKSVYQSNFPKASGAGFWDWVGQTVTDPGQSIKDAGSWYQGALGGLLSTQLWIRVLMVIFGAIALIGALILFTKELGTRGVMA